MKYPVELRKSLALAVLLLGPACKNSQAATGPVAPTDEVWLTEQQALAEQVQVSAVQERDIEDTLVANARVTFDDRRVGHVFSPVTGRVVRISAQFGQHVTKGTPLAVVESPDIGDALSDVQKASADLVAAGHDYARQKALYEEHATSAATLERAEDNVRRARAESERAAEKATLLRTGQVDTVKQSYTLVSPIDGEVLARNVNPGIEIQGQYGGGTAQELFTIGDLDRVWVVGDVYEKDLGRVHLGANVSVTVLAHKARSFAGVIEWVSTTLDPDTRTAKVRCALDNTDHALRPEMYGTMEVKVDATHALAIARTALLKLGDYSVVLVRDGQRGGYRFTRVPVDVDEGGTGAWLAVRHGVEPGQEVVVHGGPALMQRL